MGILIIRLHLDGLFQEFYYLIAKAWLHQTKMGSGTDSITFYKVYR